MYIYKFLKNKQQIIYHLKHKKLNRLQIIVGKYPLLNIITVNL